MKKINFAKFYTGLFTTILFYFHVVINTLLLAGVVSWKPFFKTSGIILTVVMGFHIFLCVLNAFNHEQRKKKFYALKWITGIFLLIALTSHGTDYMHETNFLFIHVVPGLKAAILELIFLVLSTLHIRLGVDSMCTYVGLNDNQKKVCGRICCGIATVTILVPGIIIWNFFM